MNNVDRRAVAVFRDLVHNVDEATIAWFSGWLSADGSIKKSDKNGRPAISFVICDRDPLDKFSSIFGNAVHGPMAASGLGKRPRFYWKISGFRAVILLRRCLPWLSVRYAERAGFAMEYKVKSHCGRKLTPQHVSVIKRELSNGEWGIGRKLAKQFDVTNGMICAIKQGRAWTNVSPATQ